MLRLEAVTVCVDYADHLKWTLPLNRQHFDEYTVVTALGDTATLEVAMKYGCRVAVSNRLKQGGPFNKAAALNDGLREMRAAGWIATVDADTIVMPDLRSQLEKIDADWLKTRGNLYSARRRVVRNGMELQDAVDRTWPGWEHDVGWFAGHHYGFLQVFHVSAQQARKGFAETYTTAEGYDVEFSERWPEAKRVRLEGDCIHLGEPGKNWKGRTTPRWS